MNSAHFMAVAGPLARSSRDCVEFFKLQCDPKQHLRDPFFHPSPFNSKVYENTYNNPEAVKVGILTETPFLEVSESVRRAIQISRDALKKAGY